MYTSFFISKKDRFLSGEDVDATDLFLRKGEAKDEEGE
jgi:hypothetical protein